MSFRENYARAVLTSDLSDCTDIRRNGHSTEPLAAVALGASELGSGLLRVKWSMSRNEPCPEIILALLELWRGLVRKKGLKRGWKDLDSVSDTIAHRSFWYFMHDKCLTCTGLGALAIDKNTPVLSGHVCHDCGGTGKLRYDFDESIAGRVINCVAWLRTEESTAAAQAENKLGEE
ncbi:MAG: hypothetical protein NTW90_06780 [Nitrosospira sp.]|nr:hypothetical protein [Nitrosospira sp.]